MSQETPLALGDTSTDAPRRLCQGCASALQEVCLAQEMAVHPESEVHPSRDQGVRRPDSSACF